jgi:hypothetical protein
MNPYVNLLKTATTKGYTGEANQLLLRNWLYTEHNIFIEVKPTTIGENPYYVYRLYYNTDTGNTSHHSQLLFATSEVALYRGIEEALEMLE